jgi:VWFA-related protein
VNKLKTSCSVIFLFVNLAHAQQADQMSAQQIMARTASVYSSCRTYSDEGQVSTDFGGNSGYFRSRRQRVQPFLTAFVRFSGFRYEFRMQRSDDEWDRFIAWKKDGAEKAWWSLSQHDAPLAKTLQSFVTLSGGSARTIPSLLLPDLLQAGSVVNSLEKLKLAGHDKIDDRAAFRIEGKFQGQKVKVWIDSHEFLILKIVQEEELDRYNIETTTKYKPLVNVDIADDKLAFNPPASNLSVVQFLVSARAKRQRNELPPVGDREISLTRKPKKTDSKKPKNQKEITVSQDDDDVVRVDTTLVALDVLALDKQGRFIKGLSAADFVIVEDGQAQQLTTFALGDDVSRPRTIVLIIDYSGSQLPFIRTSVEAAKTLVDKLNPKDRMAIVTDDVAVLVDFTEDKSKLKKNLDSLWAIVAGGHRLGRSAQYSALVETLRKLADEQSIRPIIIFQTDGDELPLLRQAAGYPPPYPRPPTVGKAFSIVDVFATALRSETTIYSVIPGIRLIGLSSSQQLERAKTAVNMRNSAFEELRPDLFRMQRDSRERHWSDEDWQEVVEGSLWTQKALVTLAELSGGWTDFLEQPDQAADIYARILSDINSRYIIGYQPTNMARDGKLRRVTVQVRGHPEYRVWGRTSYYAPDSEP